MPSYFKNRRFRPSLFGILLTLAGVSGGIWLGNWQLHRAEEKQLLLDQFTRGQSHALILGDADPSKLGRYQRVRISGQYDTKHQILLDNMPSSTGRAGFRVLTPLRFADGWILVDRGWLALGATRADVPDVSIGTQPGTVTGQLDDLPQPGIRMGANAELNGEAGWPRILSFPRHAELAHVLQRQLLPRILLLDATEPEGYERVWGASFGIGPARHLAYAVQWFAMAFAMFCVFVIVSLRGAAAANER